MVYDSVYNSATNTIWIRELHPFMQSEVFMTTSQKMMLVLYPLFILLIERDTGYFMLKRALKQVDRICDQVETISYGKDLTKIYYSKSKR